MKILLVEDEQKVASFIKKGLEEQTYSVDLAYDGLMGKKLALNNNYDLIIMDVILPGINGIELCKEVRKVNQTVPVLLLTALGTTEDKVEGLDAGADDYLTKPFKFQELLARIRALSRRKNNLVTPSIYSIADLEMDTSAKTVKRNGQSINLTAREFFLLEFFLKNVGRVLSRDRKSTRLNSSH